MKKFKIVSLVFLVLLLAACGNAKSSNEAPAASSEKEVEITEKEEKYVLKMVHGYPTEALHHKHMLWFAEEVKKRSEGRLEIEIYPSAQLMPADQEIPSIIQGVVDMSHTNSASVATLDPIWNVYDLPFIFNYDPKDPLSYLENREKFNNHEKGGQLIVKRMEEKGVKVLSFSTTGTFGALFTNSTDNMVTNPESAKGLKIRTPGSIITPETVKAMGASSMTIAAAELIPGLQQKVIDGVLTSASYAADAQLPIKTFTVAPLFNPITTVVISLKKFEALPEDLQQVLVDTGKDLQTYVKEVVAEGELKAYEKLEKEMGVEFYYPTEEELKEWKEVTKPAIELFDREVEGGKELLDTLESLN